MERTYLFIRIIFANCDADDRRKFNLAYNKIARYVFIKGRRDHISQFSYRIFGINFDNLLNILNV